MRDPGAVHRRRPRDRGRRPRGRPLTTPHERTGALEAVERIVNRGGDEVVPKTLAVLERLYAAVELREDGTLSVDPARADDEAFLRRVTILISAHVSSAENS